MIKIEKLNESAYKIISETQLYLDEIKQLCSAKIPNAQFLPAVRMGYSDGVKYFYKDCGDYLIVPKGFIKGIIKRLNEKYKLELSFDDEIEKITEEEFNKFVKSLKLPFEPYDFQLKAAFDSINTGNNICVMATGSGKSLTIYILCRWFIEKYKNTDDKILIIVPSVVLLNQMYSDFKEYGFTDIDKYIDRLGGDFKVVSFVKKLNISTWQSLYRNVSLFKDITVIIEDECHTAASDVHESIIFPSATNAKYRFGFTGTLPQNYCDKLSLMAVLGTAKTYVTPRELIDMGLATEMEIKPIILKYNDATSSIVRTVKNYQQEVSFFLGIPERDDIIAKLICKVSQKGNSIVLFTRVSNGENLARKVCKLKHGVDVEISELRKLNKYNIFFVSGETKASDREAIRQIMESCDDAIIFGTTSIMSTGVNIRKLKNLVSTMPGKSYIKINQSIGRMLRKHETKNNIVYLYDIVDDARGRYAKKNYMFKHYEERLKYYNENQYVIDEVVVNI
ncbi:DNA helicase [Campylobacter phage PC5]|uniref:DNA helicase n=1 Tax=Campylobacter phage PC5 TaxID=1541690 RepID=A0A1B0XVT2_9CAUD|nr:DNA helicase [Campylobacter phage PC5]